METNGKADEAFVTLATNDRYANGALVLGDSLKKVNTTKKLAILITRDISQIQRNRLSQLWDYLIEVEKLESSDLINLALIERPELNVTLTKLKIWTLVQFKKCVFLDADTLVIKNIDDLFERNELSAAPDIGWPDCFNSGVFVFVPSMETYTSLIQFANEHGSFDGGDQGLLNMYFKNWPTDLSYHLPFTYNTVSSICYTYLPAYKQYGNDVKVVHFLGASKPWSQHYDYSKSEVSFQPSAGKNDSQRRFTQLWWDRYNAIPQTTVSETTVPQPQLEQNHENQEYVGITSEQPKGQQDDGQIAWERGDIDFVWRDRFSSIQYHLDNAIGDNDNTQIVEAEYHDYYEEEQMFETVNSEQYHAQNFTLEANFEKTSSEYVSSDQSNEQKKEITENEEYRQELYVSSQFNGENSEAENLKEDDVFDPEKARMLRWENDQIDFSGEDRFEFIEQYLDNLIRRMESAAAITETNSPRQKEQNDQVELARDSSPTISLSDSAYSEVSHQHLERISRGTQTTNCLLVSTAVQTDFIETL